MNKKAFDSVNFVVITVIMLTMFIVLVFFQSQILDVMKQQAGENICKASVYFHSKLKISGKEIFQGLGLDCPAKSIIIEKESEVLPTVANELANCWDNFGEGKLNVFKDEDKTYCVPCAIINFKGLKGYHPGFLRSLTINKVPGKDMTYFEYLNGVRFTEGTLKQYQNSIAGIDKQSIDMQKPLAILFLYGKDAHTDKKLGATYGALLGLGVSVIGGVLMLSTFGMAAGITVLGVTIVSPLYMTGMLGVVGVTATTVTGGRIGYLLGSDTSADWDARVMALPYETESFKKLGCNELPVKGEANVK